jgi:hypothetical protein
MLLYAPLRLEAQSPDISDYYSDSSQIHVKK